MIRSSQIIWGKVRMRRSPQRLNLVVDVAAAGRRRVRLGTRTLP